jgi:hypothetical protein
VAATHWWRYRGACSAARQRRSPLGFAKYLLHYGLYSYQCDSIADLLKQVWSNMLRVEERSSTEVSEREKAPLSSLSQ